MLQWWHFISICVWSIHVLGYVASSCFVRINFLRIQENLTIFFFVLFLSMNSQTSLLIMVGRVFSTRMLWIWADMDVNCNRTVCGGTQSQGCNSSFLFMTDWHCWASVTAVLSSEPSYATWIYPKGLVTQNLWNTVNNIYKASGIDIFFYLSCRIWSLSSQTQLEWSKGPKDCKALPYCFSVWYSKKDKDGATVIFLNICYVDIKLS